MLLSIEQWCFWPSDQSGTMSLVVSVASCLVISGSTGLVVNGATVCLLVTSATTNGIKNCIIQNMFFYSMIIITSYTSNIYLLPT